MSRLTDRLIQKGADEAEIYELSKTVSEINFDSNKLKAINTIQSSGISLRTVVNGRMGFTSSTNVDDMDQVIENALSVSKVSEKKEFNFSRPSSYEKLELQNDKIWDIPDEALVEEGAKAIEELKRFDGDLITNLSFSKEKSEIKLLSTNGMDASYKKDLLQINLFTNMVKGTNFIFCGETLRSGSEEYSIKDMVERAKEKLSLLKITADFEQGNKSVIFTPEAMSMILLTLFQGVNGEMIEKGVSPLCGKIGERIFDERITIIDDGTLKHGANSIVFDDEGTPAERTVLFEKGVLKSYIHSLRTAEKLMQQPTGNGLKIGRMSYSKSLDVLQKPNVTNWIMEPGSASYKDMISEIKDGVIVEDIMGIFMNNLLNGDFSGNIGIGYVIKNGRVIGRVKDAAINANIYDLFKSNIVGISDKNHNANGHILPYVMLKDIFIAGKK